MGSVKAQDQPFASIELRPARAGPILELQPERLAVEVHRPVHVADVNRRQSAVDHVYRLLAISCPRNCSRIIAIQGVISNIPSEGMTRRSGARMGSVTCTRMTWMGLSGASRNHVMMARRKTAIARMLKSREMKLAIAALVLKSIAGLSRPGARRKWLAPRG